MVDNSMLFAGFVFVLWLSWGGVASFLVLLPIGVSHWGWWLGMAMGWGEGGPKDGVFTPVPPRIVLSYPIFASPSMTGKIFLPHPYPLGPRKSSLHLVKLCFLLIFLQLLQLFLIKHNSLIKIYLKLQINLSHQIKLIFSKN